MKKKNWIIAAAGTVGTAAAMAAAAVGSITYFFKFAVERTPDAKLEREEKKKQREAADQSEKAQRKREKAKAKDEYGKYYDQVKDGVEWFRAQDPERVSIMSHDGLRLAAYYLPAETESSKALILMHGYRAKELVDFSGLYRFYHEQGYHLLVPRQRSHLGSDGQYITMGVKERFDCKLWAEYVNSRLGKDCNLYLSGISMGCATVLMAADPAVGLPENVRGIIADCGYTSPYDIYKHVLKMNFGLPANPVLPLTEKLVKAKAGFGYKDVCIPDIMKKCRIPVLFIHGEKDTFVPPEMSIENYLACNAPKEILIVPDAIHGAANLENPGLYRARALEFLEKYEV